MNSIFSPKDFDKEKLRNFMQGINDLEGKKNIIRKWQKDIESKKVDQLGETQQDIPFVTDIFEKVLDYEHQNSEKWNITIKLKTDLDATKPDAVLGYFDVNGKKIVRTVIELKKTTIDLDRSLMHKGKDEKIIKTPSPVSQAFSYVPKFSGNCRWVIVSNFKEIRLYHASNSTKYEIFEVESLLEPENFAKFLFLMHKSRLFGQGEGNDDSFTDILYAEKRAAEERITIEFYNGYQDKREILFHSLCKTNPEKDKLAILSATQKLIDRLIFICFTRDVIPMPNVLLDIKQAAERIYFEQDNFFWELLNKTFKSYNKGFADRIPLFNGGLFSENEFLNTLTVKDFQLLPLIEFLLKYDFQSELNVTILGHIFEQSIADLEILKDEITKNQDTNLKPAPQNQRKTDGVFYTPDYITQYIIKNSVGTWLEEQKEILLEKHKSENIAFWEDYKIVLQNIKILDPACGSGAFLVEVFNFLLMEWQILLNELQKTTTKTKKVAQKQGGLTFDETKAYWNIRKSIIENNIFGVDLNRESVEITKLALWILQANKTVPLSDLTNNIKRGNSLIDDKNVTEWAFDWKKEFDFQFDVVVGNPPYFNIGKEHILKNSSYFSLLSNGVTNVASLFSKLALDLIKPKGYVGFIIPKSFLTVSSWLPLRKILFNETLKLVSDMGMAFDEVGLEQAIFVVKKQNYLPDNQVVISKYKTIINKIPQSFFIKKSIILTYLDKEKFNLIEKVEQNTLLLETIADMPRGISVVSKDFSSENKYNYIWVLGGINLKRFFIEDGASRKPNRYLPINHDSIVAKNEIFKQKRIVYQNIASSLPKIVATLETNNLPTDDTVNNLVLLDNNFSYEYILALLNSNFFTFYLKYGIINKSVLTVHLDKPYVGKFPIKKISTQEQEIFNTRINLLLSLYQAHNKQNNTFYKILQSQFDLEKNSERLDNWYTMKWKDFTKEMNRLNATILPKKEKQFLEIFEEESKISLQIFKQIQSIKEEINGCIYKLYDLTEEEITIIENEK